MAQESPGAAPPPEEQANQLPFDKAILEKLRNAVTRCLAEHPELRSVAIALDYNNGLNDAPQLDKGLWVGSDGPVIRPAAVFGSMFATQNLLETQFGRAVTMIGDLKDQAHVVLTETNKRKEEFEQLTTDQAGDGESAADSNGDSP